LKANFQEKGMSAELELRWLKTERLSGTVKRFAEFCKDDVKKQSQQDDFDFSVYQDAIKQVVEKLDDSIAIGEVFNAD